MKNPVYAMVISTQEVLEKLLIESLISFAPGLLEAVQSATPPLLSFFKNLPTSPTDVLAVYALVFEKAGSPFILYIGSGTCRTRGAATRWDDHDARKSVPRYVEQAYQNGYTLTHKGLLCWSPIPIPGLQFQLRVLFVAIEATLSIVLWAMKSRTKDYGMPHLCPWKIDSIEYYGACNHVALWENVKGQELGLSLEEIAALETELEEKRLLQKWTAYHGLKETIFEEFKAQRARYAAVSKAGRAQNKATRRFACDVCGPAFNSLTDLNLHNLTQNHKDKVKGRPRKAPKDPRHAAWTASNMASRKFACILCDVNSSCKSKRDAHLKTARHIKNATAAAEKAAGAANSH